jgi:hypothetical protein
LVLLWPKCFVGLLGDPAPPGDGSALDVDRCAGLDGWEEVLTIGLGLDVAEGLAFEGGGLRGDLDLGRDQLGNSPSEVDERERGLA